MPSGYPLRASMPSEAAEAFVAVQASGGAQLAGDELARGGLLLPGVDLGDGLVDQCRVDTLGAQLPGEGSTGQAPAVVTGLHPGVRERAVVDQPDLLEPRQHLVRHVLGNLAFVQGVRELLAGARGPGEQAQADRARPLSRVP